MSTTDQTARITELERRLERAGAILEGKLLGAKRFALDLAQTVVDGAQTPSPHHLSRYLRMLGAVIKVDRMAVALPRGKELELLAHRADDLSPVRPHDVNNDWAKEALAAIRDGAIQHANPQPGIGWDYARGVWATTPMRGKPQEPIAILFVDDTSDAREFTKDETDLLVRGCYVLGRTLALRKEYLAMQDQMRRDRLTGCLSKRMLQERALQMIAELRRDDGELCLLCMDLDKFKDINDMHGHGTGDEALRLAGRVFNESLRASDAVGRNGGEEFVAICYASKELGLRLAERIRANLERESSQHLMGPDGPITLTASIGVYAVDLPEFSPAYPNDEETNQRLYESALDKADRAMYAAKEAGRNQVMAWPVAAK